MRFEKSKNRYVLSNGEILEVSGGFIGINADLDTTTSGGPKHKALARLDPEEALEVIDTVSAWWKTLRIHWVQKKIRAKRGDDVCDENSTQENIQSLFPAHGDDDFPGPDGPPEGEPSPPRKKTTRRKRSRQ